MQSMVIHMTVKLHGTVNFEKLKKALKQIAYEIYVENKEKGGRIA